MFVEGYHQHYPNTSRKPHELQDALAKCTFFAVRCTKFWHLKQKSCHQTYTFECMLVIINGMNVSDTHMSA